MTFRIVFRPEAGDEAEAARRWYDAQKPGLGDRFADAIDETLERVAANPAAFPLMRDGMRRAVLRRFPFGIYFRVHARDVVVLAVMHGHRHPHHWQVRR